MDKMRSSTKRKHKKEKTEILKLKKTMTVLKNSTGSIKNRLDLKEERLNELKYK